ncbi:MAG: hypothetical protein RM368_34535 [Nostoc sp. DedSLP03]|nr:hypothetical protein [Nostoc sp. DedSLP03]MDZ7969998.1 hypothetical protein [Nostoc sp. DedSLP03]
MTTNLHVSERLSHSPHSFRNRGRKKSTTALSVGQEAYCVRVGGSLS